MSKYVSSRFFFPVQVLLAVILLMTARVAEAEGSPPLSVEVINGLPNCAALYPSEAQPTNGGETIAGPHGDVYCTAINHPNDGLQLLNSIKADVDQLGTLERVRLSALYFADAQVANWVCELGIGSDTIIELYVQSYATQAAEVRHHLDPNFFYRLLECSPQIRIVNIGCDVFDEVAGLPECVSNRTNSHHVKAALFESSSGGVALLGSGNLTAQSLSLNVEQWVNISAQSPDQLGEIACVFEFLDALSENPEARYAQQRNFYRGCTAFEEHLTGLDLVVLPFEEREFRNRMREITAQSTEITLIGQFIESEFLFELMEANQEVKFTILVDDAYHYVFSDGQDLPFNFISEESAQRLATFAQEQANVQLRFLQTNHHFESHGLTNTVHARSALFVDDTGPIGMLVGSAHWRDGAWRSNTEVQVFLNKEAATANASAFDEILARSVEIDDLPETNSVAVRN